MVKKITQTEATEMKAVKTISRVYMGRQENKF
jgi:hypothetical protein